MTIHYFLTYTVALFCGGLAVFVLFKDRRSFVHWTFAIGMITLAVEAVFRGLSLRAASPEEIIRWQRAVFYTAAFLPGIWLVFSFSFSRAGYKKYLIKWRWVALAAFLFPLAVVILFGKSLFKGNPVLSTSSQWLLPLGWSGYLFHIFFLITTVLILANLESTLRASSGAIRWQIKFMILGLASIFAVRISINSSIELLNSIVIIAANILIVLSLFRSGLLNIDIYLSETMLFRSFTVLIAGTYLFIVGLLAKIVSYFNGHRPFFIEALFVFLALLGLSVILLSNELRQRIKRLVHIHFRRPHYDYRKEWMEFTQRTSSLLDMKQLCSAMVKMVSGTFGVSSVTIWLVDQAEGKLVQCGSTAFSEVQSQSLGIIREGSKEIIRFLKNQRMPMDVDRSEVDLGMNRDFLHEAKIKYCVPLFAGNEFLGIMTLNNRVTNEEFSIEDLDLLKTIADQAAASILNMKISERVKQAKEMETIQTMSSFFVHDLKNLASTLSLTMENLPTHFGNPDFRNDALRVMKQSVSKINSMCSHLSTLSKRIELKKVETDLNELIKTSLICLNGNAKVSFVQELQPVPRLVIDPEQVQKVLTNLLLNANEATGDGCEIRLTTKQIDGWIIISVSDNGCGMSKEFMEQSLFRPFKTTKRQGMGIGLFQSKMIVEAHQGRIEVESELGKGSTFRVFLPLAGK